MIYLRNRLSQYADFRDDTWNAFSRLAVHSRSVSAGNDIIREGDLVDTVFIIDEGWCSRWKGTEDGRRQIVNFMLAGDIFDLLSIAGVKADHTVTAMTDTVILVVSARDFVNALQASSTMASAFWWAAVQEDSILREHIVRIGKRSARERIGHLLLELRRRISAATGKPLDRFDLPLTRADLADTLGLTQVHISRTMAGMKRDGLIHESRGMIGIQDGSRLAKLCQFDSDYLQLRRLKIFE